MMDYVTKKLKRNDNAISPVIGTILMVAATVIIAGAVYAAVNAYNGKTAKGTPDAAFKAQTVDTGTDGLEDTIKVTYLSGSGGAASVTIRNSDGSLAMRQSDGTTPCTASLGTAGATYACDPASSGTAAYYVTVTIGDQTVLDQVVNLKQ